MPTQRDAEMPNQRVAEQTRKRSQGRRQAQASQLRELAPPPEVPDAGRRGWRNYGPPGSMKVSTVSWPGRVDEPGVVMLSGGHHDYRVAVPDDWTPGQALAVRQLLQRAMRGARAPICPVREDVTPDQLRDIYERIGAVIRESGLAVSARAA